MCVVVGDLGDAKRRSSATESSLIMWKNVFDTPISAIWVWVCVFACNVFVYHVQICEWMIVINKISTRGRCKLQVTFGVRQPGTCAGGWHVHV